MRGKVIEAAKKLNVKRITPAYAGKRCIDFLDMVST